ncbi:MAG: hypothetical protein WCK03_04370 [Candidatus Taylorbacteria bacterium]
MKEEFMSALGRVIPDIQSEVEETQKLDKYILTFAITGILTSFILTLVGKKIEKSIPVKKIKQIRNCVNYVVAISDMIAEEVEVKDKIIAAGNDVKGKIIEKMKLLKLTKRESATILDYNINMVKEWWSSF